MTLRRCTLPARTGCQRGDGLPVGEPRALASGKSDRVRPSALSVPRARGNGFPAASRTRARAARLVLASRSVTLCDPARWIPACNETRACCPEIRRGRARARGARIGQAGAGWGQHWGHFKNRTGRNRAPKPFAGLIRLNHGHRIHKEPRLDCQPRACMRVAFAQAANRWFASGLRAPITAHHRIHKELGLDCQPRGRAQLVCSTSNTASP